MNQTKYSELTITIALTTPDTFLNLYYMRKVNCKIVVNPSSTLCYNMRMDYYSVNKINYIFKK